MLINNASNNPLSQLGLNNQNLLTAQKHVPLNAQILQNSAPIAGMLDMFSGRSQGKVTLSARELANIISDAISRTIQPIINAVMEKMAGIVQSLSGGGQLANAGGAVSSNGQVDAQTTNEADKVNETEVQDSAASDETKESEGGILEQVKDVFNQIKEAFLDPKSGALSILTSAIGSLLGSKGGKGLAKIVKGAVKMFKGIFKNPTSILKTGKKLWNKAKKLFGKLF